MPELAAALVVSAAAGACLRHATRHHGALAVRWAAGAGVLEGVALTTAWIGATRG